MSTRAVIRYLLIAGSIAAFGFCFWLAYEEGHRYDLFKWVILLSFIVGFFVNVIYLATESRSTTSRFRRLFQLWLDAKEYELRKRIDQ